MKTRLVGVSPLPLLEQARELFSSGYLVAAAVTARSACEAFVFTLCEQVGYHGNSKRAWRTHGRIDGLRKLGLLDDLSRHHCYVALEIGGDAAHGRVPGAERVEKSLDGLESVFAVAAKPAAQD